VGRMGMSAFVLKKRVLKLCWVTKSWARFGVPSSAKTEENNSRHFARDVPAMSTRGAGRGGRAARGGRGGVAITRGVVRAHPDDDGEYKTPKLSAPRSWHSGGAPPRARTPSQLLPPAASHPTPTPLSSLLSLVSHTYALISRSSLPCGLRPILPPSGEPSFLPHESLFHRRSGPLQVLRLSGCPLRTHRAVRARQGCAALVT